MNDPVFQGDGWSDYLYWQSQDRKTLKRINELIKDIQRNGAAKGIGKPEPSNTARVIAEESMTAIGWSMILMKKGTSRLFPAEDTTKTNVYL